MANQPESRAKRPMHWRDKFGGIVRKPRPWNAEVNALLHNCWPTEVFLQENETTTDIVLRFPVSSKQLSQEIQNKYFGHGLSLPGSFNEVVWAAPEKGKHSPWALLAKAGYEAYWAAWTHLLDVVYGEHFLAEANEQTKIWIAELRASRRRMSRGRRKELEVERQSFCRRFGELMQWCRDLHDSVDQWNGEKLSKDEIERRVFQKIGGQRHDHNVLSGKAFFWTNNRTNPVLHDSSTWTPTELATALIALERYGTEQAYDTVARKIKGALQE